MGFDSSKFDEAFAELSEKLLRFLSGACAQMKALRKRRSSEAYQGAFTVLKMAFAEIRVARAADAASGVEISEDLQSRVKDTLLTLDKAVRIADIEASRSRAIPQVHGKLRGIVATGEDLRILLRMLLEPDAAQPSKAGSSGDSPGRTHPHPPTEF